MKFPKKLVYTVGTIIDTNNKINIIIIIEFNG